MKPIESTELDTPLGAFYAGFSDPFAEHGPELYAVAANDQGQLTVNGVTYDGRVYARKYRADGEYHLTCQHLTRWDDKRGHHYPPSEAAARKISAVLLPLLVSMATDAAQARAARVRSLRSSIGYAHVDINRDVDTRNALAARLRELGEDVPDVPRLDVKLLDRITAGEHVYVNVASASSPEVRMRRMTTRDVFAGRTES